MEHEIIRGGAYVNLLDDTKINFRVEPGGDSVEIVALGAMKLSIGMTPDVLWRCQEVLAEAADAIMLARREG
jgi:hypothetical protein